MWIGGFMAWSRVAVVTTRFADRWDRGSNWPLRNWRVEVPVVRKKRGQDYLETSPAPFSKYEMSYLARWYRRFRP